MDDSLNYLQALQSSSIANGIEAVKSEAERAIGTTTEPISDLLIAGAGKQVLSATMPLLQNVAKSIGNTVSQGVSKLVAGQPEAVAGTVETSEGIELATMDSNIGVGELATSTAVAGSEGIASSLVSAVGSIANSVGNIAGQVASQFAGTGVGNVAGLIAQGASQVESAATTASSALTGGIDSAIGSASTMALQASEGVIGNVGNMALGQVGSGLAYLQNAVGSGLTSGLESATSAANGAVGSLSGLAGSVAPSISGAIGSATNVLTGAETAVTSGVTSAISSATSALETAGGAIASATGAVEGAVATATGALAGATASVEGAVAGVTAGVEGVAAGLSASGILAPIALLVGLGGAIASGLEAGGLIHTQLPVLNPSAQFL